MRSLADAIAELDRNVANPTAGLPDEVFYYISRTTPLVNVDLLVKDEHDRTLLSWRDDPYAGRGWHVPGGIVRFKETLGERIRKVAASELGTEVVFDPAPLALNELIHPERGNRGHFISLLYKCSLPGSFVPKNDGLSPSDPGYMRWHSGCPLDLITYHEIYRNLI